MRAPGWRRFLPAFLIGMALAAMGQVTAGVLLYDGPGMITALSVLLAVFFAALAVGILGGQRLGGPDGSLPTPPVQRLWIHALLASVGGMVFAGAWEMLGGFGATGASQTAGLVMLGALPFYTGGAVLGMISAMERSVTGHGYPGVAALLGGAVGVLGVGFVLFPSAAPTTMLFLCVLLVALGAQIHVSTVERGLAVPPHGDEFPSTHP